MNIIIRLFIVFFAVFTIYAAGKGFCVLFVPNAPIYVVIVAGVSCILIAIVIIQAVIRVGKWVIRGE